jgi:hypothetical protein
VNFIKCNVGVVRMMNVVHVVNLLQIQLIISDDVKVNFKDKIVFLSYFLKYYLDIGICTEFELEVFPKRMNTWLGEILDALVCNE